MISELLSLSLTDRPLNQNNTLETSEVIKIIVQKGGEFEYNNTTNLIIGLSVLVIATIIFIGESNWITTNAQINYLNCGLSNCALGVEYQVNNTIYKNEFTVPLNYQYPANNQVNISYDVTNPKSCNLSSLNYNNYIYILIGIGIIFMGIWYSRLDVSSRGSLFVPSLNFSSKTESSNTIYSMTE